VEQHICKKRVNLRI